MLRDTILDIKKGMTVVDPRHNEIGEVTMVMFSDEDYSEPGPETATDQKAPVGTTPKWIDDFISSLSIDTPIPEELKQRLHLEGFIKVHQTSGFANKDYFITKSQIINVTDEHVIVNTTEDRLMGF